MNDTTGGSPSSNSNPVKGADGLKHPTAEETDPGNFYAPFFDVVFYRARTEPGVVTSNVFGFEVSTPTKAFVDGVGRSTSAHQLEQSKTIGASVIRIRSSNGGIQLFDSDGEKLGDLRNYATDLSVGGISTESFRATLTLQPPFDDAIKLIDSEAIIFGSLMEIQWGYLNSGGGEPILSSKGLFQITEPNLRFGQQCVITISGQDMLSSLGGSLESRRVWERYKDLGGVNEILSDLGEVSRIDEGKKVYNTDLEVLTKLAEKISPSIELDSSQITSTSKLRLKKTGDPLVQTTTDIRFFRRVCEMNDVSYVVDFNTIILKDMTQADLAKPSYRLLWFRQPKNATDIPMISFESNSIPALFAPQGSRGFVTVAHNLDDDEVDSSHNNQEDEGGQAGNTRKLGTGENSLGGQPSVTTTGGDVKRSKSDSAGESVASTGKHRTVPDQSPNKDQERKNVVRRMRRLANTRANVTIPGHPAITPTMIVTVEGVGKKFGGTYRVLEVTHSLGTSGYVTNLELLRGTTSGDEGSSDPSAKGAVNTNVEAKSKSGSDTAPTKGESSSGFVG